MMEVTLTGIPGASVYSDHFIISDKNACEHKHLLEQALARLSKRGLRLRKDKCHFGITLVEFLGHRIYANEMQANESKIEAIL